MSKHQAFQNSRNYIHFFKSYLYGLPRRQLFNLWNEVKLPDDRTNGRIKDMIGMIAQLRLFKLVTTTKKKNRDFYHIDFIDKGLDFINISGILRSPSVTSKIPVYFQEQDPPIIGYRYNPSIAGKLFNYKKTLSPEYIQSVNVDNFQCDCQNSIFKDNHHGHIITGDLEIVRSDSLRNILKKGPKYRLPKKIDWNKNRENLAKFIEEYAEKWIGKEKKACQDNSIHVYNLQDWKIEVQRLVDKRIENGKIKINKGWSMYIEGSLKTELDRLQDLYVITPTDKAQNNIIFTCKPFYVKIMKKELSAPGLNTYQPTVLTLENVIDTTCQFSRDMGVEVSEAMRDIPVIYWIPKMHKNPTSQRFIAGSKFCTIKNLSKLFSKALKLILSHLENYNRTVFQRSGLKYFWIIDNSLEFLDNIKHLKTDNIETYDFSTLYTSLPHGKIREKFKKFFKKIFERENKKYINVNFKKAYFSDSEQRGFRSFTQPNLLLILNFILDNIYIKFGENIFKQVIGIPIGLDSGQDIANLLLYQYESTYVETISRTDMTLARKFSHCFRYIDDLFVANFPNFRQHIPLIYPPELIVNPSSDTPKSVNYLDLNIVSDEFNNLHFSIYDKRDDFSFDIVNFPYLDSCIPRKPSLGVFLSQLIRYARICSKFQDFCNRSIVLSRRLQNQGYKYTELRKLIIRFFHERGNLLEKYNQHDINVFIRNSIFHNG